MSAIPDDVKSDMAELDKVTEVSLEDFYAYMPDHRYIFAPTRDQWPATSVDNRLPWIKQEGEDKEIKPSRWLDQNAAVEQMIWAPGEPMVIKNRLIDSGGWVNMIGVSVFNLYRPPTIKAGDDCDARKWVDHIHKVYPDEADHIIKWFAQRVQNPSVKINHALVLGGGQGIGKDTILEPVKAAVGPWNFQEVSPAAMLGRFNSYVKSVILRINEARDLGDMDRFAFYDHTKVYTAAPPDVLRCDEKNIREHAVVNVCGVIITTNHKSDGIHLPADDRRHFVAWSTLDRAEFQEDYWTDLWQWYGNGGTEKVANYLHSLDLSQFDPKAPPLKTEAFWHIVSAARPAEESELADVIDFIELPDVMTLGQLINGAEAMGHNDLANFLRDRKSRRQIPHRLESLEYEPVRNEYAKDGLWKINGRRQAVYGKKSMTLQERYSRAESLSRDGQ